MIKLHAKNLLGMCFPQDKSSKLNQCLTEIQVTNMLNGALECFEDNDMITSALHLRVLQVVQNRREPYTATGWIHAYTLNMMSRIAGDVNEDYCRVSAENSLEALGIEWMVTTPAEAVQAEMECWDD